MKTFSEFMEAFQTGVNVGRHYVEVFHNPTHKELRQAAGKLKAVRGWLHPDGNMHIHNAEMAVHDDTRKLVKDTKKSMPVHILFNGKKASVHMSWTANRNPYLYRNVEEAHKHIQNFISNHKHLNKLFKTITIHSDKQQGPLDGKNIVYKNSYKG